MKNTRKRNSVIAFVLALACTFSLAGCASVGNDPSSGTEATVPEEPLILSLEFEEQQRVWTKVENDEAGISYYTVDKVVYCTNPTNPEMQSLRFYVPAEYLNDDGTVNTSGSVGNYTAETAPIIYINNCSGYAGDVPYDIFTIWRLAGDSSKHYGWYYNYLKNGFVIVFAGERGKSTCDENGNVIGSTPIPLVDLKAGIRFLKHNSGKFPGDTDKIISNGVSAGGAMSVLLGVTGNSTVFDSYLTEMGAAMDVTDDVFATQAYCPIIDLDHAALAYEWMWQGDEATGEMGAFEKAISAKLAAQYAVYLNSLGLTDEEGNPLTLNENGSREGSFYDWLISQYEASYDHYVTLYGDVDSAEYDWLTYSAAKGTRLVVPSGYTSVIEAMELERYNPRQKACVSFDPFDYMGDNAVFGVPMAEMTSADAKRHFTPDMPAILESLKEEFPDEYASYYDVYLADVTNEEVLNMIWLYNPYHYISDSNTDISNNFRICVGTQDRDTSPSVSAVLALLLRNAGYDVEYTLIWNQIHIDADFEGEFEAWVNSICTE